MSAENESERRGNRFQESERIRRREIEIGWFQNLFRILKIYSKYNFNMTMFDPRTLIYSIDLL